MKSTQIRKKRLNLDDRLALLSFQEMRDLLAQDLNSPIKRRAKLRLKQIAALGLSPNELHGLLANAFNAEQLYGEKLYNRHLLQIHHDQLVTDLEAQKDPEFDTTLLHQLIEFVRENGSTTLLKMVVAVSDAVGDTETAEGVEDYLYSFT